MRKVTRETDVSFNELVKKTQRFFTRCDDLEITTDGEETVMRFMKNNCDIGRVFFSFDKSLVINAKDKRGCTMLHYAAHRGHYWIVKELLENGADHTIPRDRDGKTALHLATRKGHVMIIKKLLKYGWMPTYV